MGHLIRARPAIPVVGVLAFLLMAPLRAGQQDGPRFQSGVELVNVSATVTDLSGRFVTTLKQSDFFVYEDDKPVAITNFSAERVPVSLGIVLDTSGSMRGQKIVAARAALDRFLFELLGAEDEVFLYRFDTVPHLVQGWTDDRRRLSSELREVQPDGSTALYDAVSAALSLVKSGRHRKKALLVISDGMDTSSRLDVGTLRQAIYESEALVYAIGMDVRTSVTPFGQDSSGPVVRQQRRGPIRLPVPFPGRRTPPRVPPIPGIPKGLPPRETPLTRPGDRGNPSSSEADVDAPALRGMTDDSGGRTAIVRDPRDLAAATAAIADELSRQDSLAYLGGGYRDGRWHTIRVEVRGQSLRVRARRGYLAPAASP